MGPEILIVGDRAHRGELVPRVQDLGYSVSPVRARELLLQVARSPGPAAVIVCLGDADATGLVRSLRQSPEGATVPVLLYGRLQGDLADVLELGADRFLEAPVSDAELSAALNELAGPPELAPKQTPAPSPEAPVRTGDPALGKLHRTLEVLAARLEGEEEAGEGAGDGIDLEAMGLDAVPDVDREHDSGEFELLPETTQRLPRTTPERGATTTAIRGGGGRWSGRRDLTLSRPEEISGGADPHSDPSAERTAPVATARREDVRKDRLLRGRGVDELSQPQEAANSWSEEHALQDMREIAHPPRQDGRRLRWTDRIEPTRRVRTRGEEAAGASWRVRVSGETDASSARGSESAEAASWRVRGSGETDAAAGSGAIGRARTGESAEAASWRVRTSRIEETAGSGATGRARTGENAEAAGASWRVRTSGEVDTSGRVRTSDGENVAGPSWRDAEASGRVRGSESVDGVSWRARTSRIEEATGSGATGRARTSESADGASGRARTSESADGASWRVRTGESADVAGASGRVRASESEAAGSGAIRRAGRVEPTEMIRARDDAESTRSLAARGRTGEAGRGDGSELAVRTGFERRGMTVRTDPRNGLPGDREPTARLVAGTFDGLAGRAVGGATRESDEGRPGAGLSARTGGSASRGVEGLPRLGPPRSRGQSEAAALLAELRRERFTGGLQVTGPGMPERRLWWSEGQVVGGASAAPEESVLGRLTARGLIGPVQLELAARWSTGDPRRDVERLAQAGLLKPQEMQEALREPVRRVVERIAEAGEVAWALHPGASPPLQVELGVPLAALIASGVRRGAVLSHLREVVGDGRRPRLSFAGPEALAAELRWPEVAAIAGRFDGRTSVGELVAEVIADEVEIRAAVHVLGLLGHLAPEVDDPEASLIAVDRRRVRERLRLARENDHYALLGVPRTATRAEVLRAHADLSATFREGLEPASKVELAAEVEELLAALDEARDVLVDDALRTAYLAQLAAGAKAREAR